METGVQKAHTAVCSTAWGVCSHWRSFHVRPARVAVREALQPRQALQVYRETEGRPEGNPESLRNCLGNNTFFEPSKLRWCVLIKKLENHNCTKCRRQLVGWSVRVCMCMWAWLCVSVCLCVCHCALLFCVVLWVWVWVWLYSHSVTLSLNWSIPCDKQVTRGVVVRPCGARRTRRGACRGWNAQSGVRPNQCDWETGDAMN